jgi:ABC-type multidrug transport system fused ATPase/permease subunit
MIYFFDSNIKKIENGIGLDLLLLTQTLLFITGSFIASFIINWQLTLIMLCILPFTFGASVLYSNVRIIIRTIKHIRKNCHRLPLTQQ